MKHPKESGNDEMSFLWMGPTGVFRNSIPSLTTLVGVVSYDRLKEVVPDGLITFDLDL